MIYLSGLVGFLFLLTAEARVGPSSDSPYCRKTNECLLFHTHCKNKDYEVRHYHSVNVVSTNSSSLLMEFARTITHRRLLAYIMGANEDGVRIDETAPHAIKITENRQFWQAGVFTMSFLLPSKYQAKAPKPTDDKVYIQKTGDFCVYVKGYKGWMTTLADKNKAKRLSSDLDSVGAKYKKGFHYGVAYDGPGQLFNKYNEVWYLVEGTPRCTRR